MSPILDSTDIICLIATTTVTEITDSLLDSTEICLIATITVTITEIMAPIPNMECSTNHRIISNKVMGDSTNTTVTGFVGQIIPKILGHMVETINTDAEDLLLTSTTMVTQVMAVMEDTNHMMVDQWGITMTTPGMVDLMTHIGTDRAAI